ncbi:hypothetical protein IEQ34_004672 [Dendrobium chrysotoxum]|uniref:Protein RIK n=1 Tax=Dendrobium chrysotoxum TaxID=161865 RepID=A0AAV7HHW0_DENCH|nr:hypothetical protein IEQ34_004672 [Dendrobium chrysotoxum]
MAEDAGTKPSEESVGAASAMRQRKKRRWDEPADFLISTGVSIPGAIPIGFGNSLGISTPGVLPVSNAIATNTLVPLITQSAATLVQKLSQSKVQDELIAREIVINDAEPTIRYKLTKRQTQEEIQRSTGAIVITRGKYRPPNALPDNEKPLYLHISAGSHLKDMAERIIAVDRAASMVEEILRQGHNLLSNSGPYSAGQVNQPMSICLFLGFEPDPSQNIAARIRGPNDQYINHIINETGATVVLRGLGSGNNDISHAEDAQQPLHLYLSSTNSKSLEAARSLAENLLDTISAECAASRCEIQALLSREFYTFYWLEEGQLTGKKPPSSRTAGRRRGGRRSVGSLLTGSLERVEVERNLAAAVDSSVGWTARGDAEISEQQQFWPLEKFWTAPYNAQKSLGQLLYDAGDFGQQFVIFRGTGQQDTLAGMGGQLAGIQGKTRATWGRTRGVPSSKVYRAVPPPHQLLAGIVSSANAEVSVNPVVSSSCAVAGVTQAGQSLASSTSAVSSLSTVLPSGVLIPNGNLASCGTSISNTGNYVYPTVTGGTCYSGYGGIYPQATPLQQVALALKQAPLSTTSVVSSAASHANALPKMTSSSNADTEKRPPQKRKFQELPVTSKGLSTLNQNSRQGSECFKPGLEDAAGKISFMPPTKKLSQPAPGELPLPPPRMMPPPPPKFPSNHTPRMMPPPPPKFSSDHNRNSIATPPPPNFPSSDSPVGFQNQNPAMSPAVTETLVQSIVSEKASVEPVSDTLLKLVEYEEEEEEEMVASAEDSFRSNIMRSTSSKPFWAV